MKLECLTKEQEQKLSIYAEKWKDKLFSLPKYSKEEIIKSVEDVYKI